MTKTRAERKAEFQAYDEMLDSLPDGAYFAAMAEYGFDADEIIDLSNDEE